MQSPKFPDPEPFDKGNFLQYARRERQIREKLKYNNDRFVSEEVKVAYISMRTKGITAEDMENFLQGDNRITAVKAFFEKIQGRFDNPNARKIAKIFLSWHS